MIDQGRSARGQRLRERLSGRLDHLVRPARSVRGKIVSSFHVCGLIGWVAAISLALLLTRERGLSLWVMMLLVGAAIGTFVALVWLSKLITREEILVYYHHEIAVTGVSCLLLTLVRRPVLPYLDIVFMGLGLFLACGRIGCLMVGCCHGQPSSWGVSYGPEHVKAGFAPHLVGVRLFPIQLVEAVFVAVAVAVGTIVMLRGAAPGSAFVFYSIAYGLARFSLELFRGDTARPYWRGGSEAQWTSFVILVMVLGLSGLGPVPFGSWLLAATLVMGAALVVGMATDNPVRRLFRPRHVAEIAALLDAAHAHFEASDKLHIGRTSLGLRISASMVHDGQRRVDVFAFSEDPAGLDDETARRVARLISRLRRAVADSEVQRGGAGVYHVILPSTAPERVMAHAV